MGYSVAPCPRVYGGTTLSPSPYGRNRVCVTTGFSSRVSQWRMVSSSDAADRRVYDGAETAKPAEAGLLRINT